MIGKSRRQIQKTPQGCTIMNAQNLVLLSLMQGLSEYPQVNNKLYLQFKVISKIENLEPYKNLKALYLQNNVIKKIENIGCLQQLQSLFLHNNMITTIENIDCFHLKILNLSNNQIHKIQGLDHLKELQSLTLSKNFLKFFESVQHLGSCSETLTNIDLTQNRIQLDERIIHLFTNVKCLYLTSNPFVNELHFYRRRMIGQLPQLVYLDQKGVDQEQRIRAVAWVKDGDSGFEKAKLQIEKLKATQKAERSKEVMKDIDVHLQKRINVFKGAIEDCRQEIRKHINMIGISNMKDFYMNKIEQQQKKITTYQDSIQDLQKRIGKKTDKV